MSEEQVLDLYQPWFIACHSNGPDMA